jgi:hypothetical protein
MKRSAIVFVIACLAVALSALACSSAAPAPMQSDSRSAPSAPPAAPGASSSASDSSQTAERMVIRTAFMEMVVSDVQATLDKIDSLAKEMGGFVVSSESREQGGDRVGQASIRVPSDRMDESIKRLGAMATKVSRQSVTNKDVTEEYVDQDARLRTLRATESQYLELLKTAKTTEDILKIQQSLGQIRGQIEQTQGRLQYLQRSTEMSVISMSIVTQATARPVGGGGWSPVETAYEAFQGLVGAAMTIAALAIWVLMFIPIWVPAIFLIRWWRRRGRRGAPPLPPAEPATDPAPSQTC